MQPGWCQPVRQEFMENECEALPGVAYPGVRDNRSTLNIKIGYDDDDDDYLLTYYRDIISIYPDPNYQQYLTVYPVTREPPFHTNDWKS